MEESSSSSPSPVESGLGSNATASFDSGNTNMQHDNESNNQTDCDNNKNGTTVAAKHIQNEEESLNYNHQCYICDKTFSANSNLNRHLRKIHQEDVQSPYNNVKCALCESLFASSCMYTKHLENDHKVEIVREHLEFQTREAFEQWKHAIENETTTQFIKSRGEKRTKSVNKTYYSCNRSGYYISKARTQKALKKQGSRKINGRCPASMNVTVNEDSSYDVRFIKTHVGHDFELKHLDLSDKDRDLIVKKLASGVTKREIIRQLRSSSELQANYVASSASPTTSVISSNGELCQPIVINNRAARSGCNDHNVEMLVCPVDSLIEVPTTIVATTSMRTRSSSSAQQGQQYANKIDLDEPPAPQISRLHLATTKDIHNIINSKHLDSKKIRHNYDLNALDAYVNELRELDPHQRVGPVLIYKDQTNPIERFPKLGRLDFMLAIMKEGQAAILKQNGANCIIMDSTHQVHCEYLHVTYMSVIDDDNKVFPVAFLFSSRTDTETLEVFITLIKERVGSISTRMLIADDLHDFYQAWWKVMTMPVHNLLTPWSVFDRLSRKFDLVKSREKLRKLKKQIRSLLMESEADKFASGINQMVSDYKKDPDTIKFIEFFEDQFAKNPDIWSNSFRKTYAVSNYQLWNMHDKFKLAYKEGKNSKEICKYLTCLMSLYHGCQLDKLIRIESSNEDVYRQALAARHKKGTLTVTLYEVVEEPPHWLCPTEWSSKVCEEVRYKERQKSRESNGTSGDKQQNGAPITDAPNDSSEVAGAKLVPDVVVVRKKRDCCELNCHECRGCRHEFKCTCLDYVLGLNICKHIHRVSALCKMS